MMLSDMIAQMIEEMLSAEGGSLELRRNDLAERVGCVPSQINYVIASRFTPERGYIIESRRGGGGYIRITKKAFDKNQYVMHLFFGIGNAIDAKACAKSVGKRMEKRFKGRGCTDRAKCKFSYAFPRNHAVDRAVCLRQHRRQKKRDCIGEHASVGISLGQIFCDLHFFPSL